MRSGTCDEPSRSFNLDNVVRPPRFVEERLSRAVEAKEREPTPTRPGPDPVLLFSRRGLRGEVDVYRAIGIGDRSGLLADARTFLAILQL